jgi:hypothetical protein
MDGIRGLMDVSKLFVADYIPRVANCAGIQLVFTVNQSKNNSAI